ncbi:MAG: hypothetical protein M4579_000665 [Chaenotheca gracillima]|nr:MAG: hypothetical protein M4579_000665 [Chaenotheca gracillima]
MAAAAAIEIPHSNRAEPGSFRITPASYPKTPTVLPKDVDKVAEEWAASFNNALASSDSAKVSQLFAKNSYWRDHLLLSWEFHTIKGADGIAAFLRDHKGGCPITALSADRSSDARKPAASQVDYLGNVKAIQTFVTVETAVARGRGLLRLVQDDDTKWKAYTFFTRIEELKGFEEANGIRRPNGVAHGAHLGRLNWKDRRTAEENFEGGLEPTVLIVGCGQGGLTSAARLKQLGVQTLVVDRCQNVGDTWRNRYHQLVLHDPIWYDHMPYMPFPSHWPIFTPKDKLAEWFEFYAQSLELNIWTKSTITESKWDATKRQWTVTIERETKEGKKETRVLHPRHIVQATGHSGEPNFPSHIKGIKDFKGESIVHSSQFKGPKPGAKGKKAIVVGCCNSGHDIAQDYYESGYDVTMVQRSSTTVVNSKTLLDVQVTGVFGENGPPVEDADIINMSYPLAVLQQAHAEQFQEMVRRDAPMLEGLTRAGFKLDSGPNGAGLFMKYFQRGGGYYIDVGASQLIADGKIKIKQGQEITQIKEHSMVFADGTELPADEIVFATGYQNMRETARKIFGNELADGVNDVWGFDEEGETRTMWRRTGHPGFWFFGGNLALCRYFSRLLALQIKALEEGVMKYEDA